MKQTEQNLRICSWNLEGSTQGSFECPAGVVGGSCDSYSDSMRIPSRSNNDSLCLARSRGDGHVYLMPKDHPDYSEWLSQCKPVRVEYHNTTDPDNTRQWTDWVETASTEENRCWETRTHITHEHEGWTPSVVFSGSEKKWCLPQLEQAPRDYLETRVTGMVNTFLDLLPASSVGALALQELDAQLISELRTQLRGTHLKLLVGDASERTDSLGFLYTFHTMNFRTMRGYALKDIVDELGTPNWQQPRGALIARFATISAELTIANVHLKAGIELSQTHAIQDIIAHLQQINRGVKASNPIIVLCGDFNDRAPPDMRGYKRFSNGSVDSIYISQLHAEHAQSTDSHASESMSRNTADTVSRFPRQRLADEHVVPYGDLRLSDHAPISVVIRPGRQIERAKSRRRLTQVMSRLKKNPIRRLS